MSSIRLPYNREVLEVTLPATVRCESLLPRPGNPLSDPHGTFLAALESPDGTPSLSTLAGRNPENVLIVAQDHTRVCAKDRTLKWVVDYLNDLGIPDENINVLIALGSHKPATEEKLRETVGGVIDRVKVEQHDVTGPMVDYGVSSRGTPLRLNAKLSRAGLVILLTTVVHHYFAGYGGGRKIILPGLSSLESIASNHSLTFSDAASGGRHPAVKSGSLDGNPVHEDMLECARLGLKDRPYICVAGGLLASKEFGFFASGELDSAHRAACRFIDETNVLCVREPADVVIGSAGGYPKDGNVIQSHKGMDNAVRALKPGGTLLYLMGCSDGYGNPAIEEFAPLTLTEIRGKLAENYVVYGQTVYALKEKAAKYRIVLLTGLEPDFVRLLGMEPAGDIGKAMEMIGPELEGAGLVYHMPRCDLVVPECLQTP